MILVLAPRKCLAPSLVRAEDTVLVPDHLPSRNGKLLSWEQR